MKKSLSLNKLKLGALTEKMIANADAVKGGLMADCHLKVPTPTSGGGCDNLSGNGGFTG
ncbi:hypothetical protein [Hymenobacter aquaticus]|nr:hypothetical protein [Hymenobacter aquaticus]